ncbi:MAG: hypothetical protein KC486_28415 [Myxococcales bacterium]|nr:hypothetical protein [Myxococcales bacterium]
MQPRVNLGLAVALLAACTTARPPADAEPRPTADKGDAPMPEPAAAEDGRDPAAPVPADVASDEPLEPLALRCDGAALARALASRDLRALKTGGDGPSVRLLATWEAVRTFGDDDTLAAEAVDALVEALTAQLGRAPPRWWIDHLASARWGGDASQPLPYYDVQMTATGDRRGELVEGPGKTRVRPELLPVLAEGGGKLHVDLSAARVAIADLPENPGTVVEVARARAGSTLYVATYELGAGGFRFPLRAVTRDGQRWEATVCGPDRQVLGGVGYMIAELVVLEPTPDPDARPGVMRPSAGATGIAVFTGETHGVAVDVFDPATGERTLAWSSDLWFARP